ncbi:MAG: ankyrin repeat domain-containing protein [Candidatus Thiodiazotropha endolucinida]
MLTLEEILDDVGESPDFRDVKKIGVNCRGINEVTPLHWIATLGDVEGIRVLTSEGAVIDAIDSFGNTPLHEAISCRQVAATELLIELGANRNLKNQEHLTPEDIALSDGFHPMIELLGINKSK